MLLSLCVWLAPTIAATNQAGHDPFSVLPLGALVRLGSLHDLPANSQTPVALLPDGKTIVTGERRGLRFVDLASGKQIRLLARRCDRVLNIVVAPNGKRIAAVVAHEDVRRDGSISQSLWLFDVEEERLLWSRGGVGYSYPNVCFASEGKRVYFQRIDWEKGKHLGAYLCQTDTGMELGTDLILRQFAVSPDCKTTAYGTVHGDLFIHGLDGGVSRVENIRDFLAETLAWSRDKQLVAAAGYDLVPEDKKNAPRQHRLVVIDVAKRSVIHNAPVTAEIKALAFAPDARILGVLAGDGALTSLRLVESTSGKPIWSSFERVWPFNAPQLLKDGTRLNVERAESGHVLISIYDSTGKEQWRWWTNERLAPAHEVRINNRPTVISGLPFVVYDIASGRIRGESGGHLQAVRELQFSPGDAGTRLISIDEGNLTRIWRPALSNTPDDRLPRREGGAARFLRDGTLVFIGFDGNVRVLRDANTNPTIFTIAGMLPSRSAFDLNSLGLLAVLTNGGLELWDVTIGRRLTIAKSDGRDRAVVFSPDGRFLLVETSDGHVRLFSISRSPAELRCLRSDLPLTFSTARFSPDGKFLAAREKSKLRVINTTDGTDAASWDHFREFAFAPGRDSAALAVERIDGSRRLVLLPSGRDMAALQTGAAPNTFWDAASACTIAMPRDGASERIVFSPDGRLFATTGEKVAIYEVATNRLIGQLPDGHPDSVSTVAFSSDGRKLATGGSEGTIVVWDWAIACGLIAKEPRTIDELWLGLRHADARQAYGALFELSKTPAETTAYLRRVIAPAARDFKDVRALVEDLDSESFRKRDAASRALRLLGAEAEPFLRLALSKSDSAELEKRINELLAEPGIQTLGVETIRTIRAIHLLEMIGTADARVLLSELAKGDPQRIITRAARANAK